MTASGGSSRRRKYGWTRIGFADALGIPLLLALTVAVGSLFPARLTADLGLSGAALLPLLGLSVVMAGIEELFFRSYLLAELLDAGWRPRNAVGLTSAAFAALHFRQGWEGVLFAAFAGSLYALFFLRRRNVVPLLFSHALHNVLAILLAVAQ